MTVIKRGEVAAPVVPKETVEVPALDGEVVVRGLLLSERLAIQGQISKLRGNADADAKDDAEADAKDDAEADAAAEVNVDVDPADPGNVHAILPVVLAICVLDADGLPVFTKDQWQVFGGKYAAQAVNLFNVAWRLSGFATAAVKKN